MAVVYRQALVHPRRRVRQLFSTFTNDLAGLIEKITVKTAAPLVPKVKLHLITPACKLWRSSPEDCPINDPYWAFFWPGGQALCRYLLDNCGLCQNKRVLDIGAGAGALSIVAAKCKAALVVANDIDPVALIAAKMNARLNFGQEFCGRIKFSPSDILPKSNDAHPDELEAFFKLCHDHDCSASNRCFDVVLVGDMCYDREMSSRLLTLLRGVRFANPDTCILLGDPGRHGFLDLADYVKEVEQYPLPVGVEESCGFPSVSVYRMKSTVELS